VPTEAVWDIDRAHYRVKIGARWYAVPDAAVVTEPNRLGHVWYWQSNGEIVIRCFLPGAGT
jgi:hypothetical protein